MTPLPCVNTGNYTYESRGEAAVPLVGKGDKRNITATFTVTADDLFIPIQIKSIKGLRKGACQREVILQALST